MATLPLPIYVDKHKRKSSPLDFRSFSLSTSNKIFHRLGIGCASFGHSCYGGHGKRSDPSVVGEEIEAADQPSIPMRVLQRRFSFQPDTPTNEGTEHEKEVKLLILGVLSEVVSEAMKKSAGTDQDTLA